MTIQSLSLFISFIQTFYDSCVSTDSLGDNLSLQCSLVWPNPATANKELLVFVYVTGILRQS